MLPRILRGRSIDRRLLLLTTGLLLVTVSAFSWTAYRKVERATLVAAAERLRGSSAPVAQMLEESLEKSRGTVARLTNDRYITGYLSGLASREDAMQSIAKLLTDTTRQQGRFQLRGLDGAIRLDTGTAALDPPSAWVERTIATAGLNAGEFRISPI